MSLDNPADPGSVTELGGQIQAQIEEYEGSLSFTRSVAIWYKVAEVFFAALATISVGLSSSKVLGQDTDRHWSGILSGVALAAGTVATATTALEGFVGFRDNWVRYANTWSALRMIYAEYLRKTKAETRMSVKEYNSLVEEFEQILKDSHRGWGKARGK